MEDAHAPVGRIQAQQLGLISVDQLGATGTSRKRVRHLVERGQLERARRGVYVATAVAPSYEQSVLAAVLAAGDTAFASHLTAVWMWDWPCEDPEAADIDVTTVLERRPRLQGVKLHRSGLLHERDVTRLRGIPVSTPERTIIDCSSQLSVAQLGAMTDDAVRRRITTIWRIMKLADRLRPAPGRSLIKVREMLDRRVPGVEERESVLEDFVFDALRTHGLPLPVAQHWIRLKGKPRRIDLCYPDDWLALEPMGFEFHGPRERFDDDAVRGNELQLAGFRVLTFTSAFTDRTIAEHVSDALKRPIVEAAALPKTFAEWLRER